MNFIKLNTILSVAFLFLLAGLSSCENVPVGESALFPEDESTHVVKAYIDNYCFYPKNTMQSHLLQLGAGGELSGGDKPVELKVQLTHVATQDLTFSLVVDRTKYQPEDDETILLGEDAVAFGRRCDSQVIKNAATIAMLYFVLFFFGGITISVYEGLSLQLCLYEAASAVGTVGLTLGVTPGLHIISRMILIVLMYLGRVGGMT